MPESAPTTKSVKKHTSTVLAELVHLIERKNSQITPVESIKLIGNLIDHPAIPLICESLESSYYCNEHFGTKIPYKRLYYGTLDDIIKLQQKIDDEKCLLEKRVETNSSLAKQVRIKSDELSRLTSPSQSRNNYDLLEGVKERQKLSLWNCKELLKEVEQKEAENFELKRRVSKTAILLRKEEINFNEKKRQLSEAKGVILKRKENIGSRIDIAGTAFQSISELEKETQDVKNDIKIAKKLNRDITSKIFGVRKNSRKFLDENTMVQEHLELLGSQIDEFKRCNTPRPDWDTLIRNSFSKSSTEMLHNDRRTCEMVNNMANDLESMCRLASLDTILHEQNILKTLRFEVSKLKEEISQINCRQKANSLK